MFALSAELIGWGLNLFSLVGLKWISNFGRLKLMFLKERRSFESKMATVSKFVIPLVGRVLFERQSGDRFGGRILEDCFGVPSIGEGCFDGGGG
jgi:hypothetical protein